MAVWFLIKINNMKAKVIETGEIVDFVSILDAAYKFFISYWDVKNGKEYSRFELDFSIDAQMKGVQINDETAKPIDWEQRRYEIARDIIASSFDRYAACISIKTCLQWADALIEELKRKEE